MRHDPFEADPVGRNTPRALETGPEACPGATFFGYCEAGQAYNGRTILGNHGRKKDAQAQAEAAGAKVEGYLNGKFKRGWLVIQPGSVAPAPLPPLAVEIPVPLHPPLAGLDESLFTDMRQAAGLPDTVTLARFTAWCAGRTITPNLNWRNLWPEFVAESKLEPVTGGHRGEIHSLHSPRATLIISSTRERLRRLA